MQAGGVGVRKWGAGVNLSVPTCPEHPLRTHAPKHTAVLLTVWGVRRAKGGKDKEKGEKREETPVLSMSLILPRLSSI